VADDDIRGLLGSVQDYLVKGGLDEDARYVLGPHAYEGLSKFASLANFLGPGADVKDIASESAGVMEGDPAAFVGLPAALAMMALPGSKSGVEEVVDQSGAGLSGLRWYRGTDNPSELNVVSGGKEGTLGGGGVYLTPDPESASMYASETITGAPKTGGFVLPLTAKFDNPLIVELNKEKGYFAEGRVLEELGMNREKAFDKAEKALDTKGSLTNEVKSKAIKAGHDGVILVRDGEIQEAISYRPEDIRSIFEGGTQAINDVPTQAISSADTSLRQVPALFKKQDIDFPEGGTNFDIGGGRFDEGTKYLADERGVENFVYDPYNRSPKHNADILDKVARNPADTATAANVLNVIAEPEARADVIRQAMQNIKPGGAAYFQIYEGAGTGVGKVTSKGFQNNKKTANYIGEVEEIFGPDNVRRKGNVIIATKPVEYRRGGSVVERSNKHEPKAI